MKALCRRKALSMALSRLYYVSITAVFSFLRHQRDAGGVAVAFEVIASAVGVAHDFHPPVRARADLSIPAICRTVCH